MHFYIMCGRVATYGGLLVAIVFFAMSLGESMQLGPLSDLASQFIKAGGTFVDLLMVGSLGFAVFALGAILLYLNR